MLMMVSAGAVLFTCTDGAEAATFGDFEYDLVSGSIRITGYTGPGGHVTIPDTIDSKPVQQIGNAAFYGSSLTSVTIPDSVTNIADGAFWDCPSLTSVTIPDSVTTIGASAFESCTSLKSIVIPDSVTTIGTNAFGLCSSLSSIEVGGANAHYASLDGVLYNKDKTTLITYPGGKAGAFTIPGIVTTIGDGAFFSCSFLTSAIIPDSVTTIGQFAFYGSSLESITFLGDAPTVGGNWATNAPVTAHYIEGANGFTTPTWNGVPCEVVYKVDITPPSSSNNLAAGTYWCHQLSTTPGVSITVSGAGTSWIQASGGVLSGVPPTAGVYEVTVTLSAPDHIGRSQTFTLTVVPELVVMNSPAAGAIAYVVV